MFILSGKTFRHSGDITSYMDVHVVHVHVAYTFFHSHFPSLSYLYLFYCVYLYHGQVSCRVDVLLIADSGDPSMARSEKIVT